MEAEKIGKPIQENGIYNLLIAFKFIILTRIDNHKKYVNDRTPFLPKCHDGRATRTTIKLINSLLSVMYSILVSAVHILKLEWSWIIFDLFVWILTSKYLSNLTPTRHLINRRTYSLLRLQSFCYFTKSPLIYALSTFYSLKINNNVYASTWKNI